MTRDEIQDQALEQIKEDVQCIDQYALNWLLDQLDINQLARYVEISKGQNMTEMVYVLFHNDYNSLVGVFKTEEAVEEYIAGNRYKYHYHAMQLQ